MHKALQQIRQSTFVRHNAIFFVGSLTMGLLNYLYYPIMGRLLHPSSFGEVQTLFSLFAQITIFLGVLGLITVNIVANYDNEKQRNRLILELEKLALVISLGLLLASIIAGPSLQHFFKFDSPIPFAVLVGAVVVSVPLTFRTAYLRGQKRFGLVSLAGIVGAAADLLVSVVFVLMGWGTTGAIGALVIAQALGLLIAAQWARNRGLNESLTFRAPDIRLIFPELKYAGLVLLCSLTITGLYSVDIIVIKHYFDAHTAGMYAGVSTVARIIFFLTISITQVLLPNVKLQHTAKQNHQALLKSFVLIAGVGGGALLIFALLPRLVIGTLMGHSYLQYASLLPKLSLALFIISLLNLLIMYNMALRRYGIALIVIIGAAVTFVLMRVHHSSPQAVVDSLLFSSLSMIGLLGIWMAYTTATRKGHST